MQFVIVSGLSGAGKSKAASDLEDFGFYCVDNMPAEMIPQFASLCLATKGRYEKVALVTDVRGSLTFDTLFRSLDRLDEMTEQAFDDQCTGANPRYPLMSEIRQMYLNAYYGN